MGAYIINVPSTVDRIIYVNVHPMDGKTYLASYSVDELTPYTEPDLEQVRKEAYQKGYETGYEDGYNEPGKGKMQVGNEVKCIRAGWTAIVTRIREDGRLTLMGNDGALAESYDEKEFIKTGRHFPEIVEVLQRMKEADNG